ncbi:gig2-like protein DreN isoform X1 [Cyprinus carpio]|uniref:Gig2-like protein DreN isoform X1 n=2 Tax=Cyprinus carpio TaxID=7962 RepID=A0A8C2ABR4_CYPCA|nr:gig2-like protein DreN isoform X1 [Cyprinus carpio]
MEEKKMNCSLIKEHPKSTAISNSCVSAKMPLEFSGWEAYCDKSKHLKPGQEPKKSHGYIMYHGTHKSNAPAIISSGFRPSAGGTLGPGVYCSRNINKAMGYPACAPNDRVILKLRVRVGKVKKIEGQSLNLKTTWHQQGYDTAWLPATASGVGLEEDCVWDPKRITVVGIAHCTDSSTKSSLESLIKQGSQSQDPKVKDLKPCKGCGMQTEDKHTMEKCWSCKASICPFMKNHVCQKKRK